jgi:chromosomal replication initiator protein
MNTELIEYIKSSPRFQEAINQAVLDYYSDSERSKIPDLQEIAMLVSSHFKIPLDKMKKKCREREIINARHVCIYLQYLYCQKPIVSIGQFFGQDHTTVLHAKDKVKDLIDCKDLVVIAALDKLEPKIREYWKDVIMIEKRIKRNYEFKRA